MNSVLIVDDETINLQALTQILSPDYKIYAAKDGVEALKLAREYKPDVILLDILMEGMDGYNTLIALKKSDETRDIPVIYVTGLDSPGDKDRGIYLGASDYITKPFGEAIVKLRVENQIRLKELEGKK